jgi:hypothetical protein
MKSKLSSEETQQIKAARDRESARVIEMRKSER